MTTRSVNAVPKDMHTVTPHLICAGAAAAIDFYKKAFGAVEVSRMAGPDGKIMNAIIRIGDSPVLLVDENPQWGNLGPKTLKGSPVVIHLSVDDADALAVRAAAAGAKITLPVSEMFWGARYGQLEDPFGHRWSVATQVRDVTPEQMQAAVEKMGGG
jgi:PhnB protein